MPWTKSLLAGRPMSLYAIAARAVLGIASFLTACDGFEPVPPAAAPITDPTQVYRELVFDHPAVTLAVAAPYHTYQLVARPFDAEGTPMSGLPAPTYKSLDTTRVRVSADGTITAVAPTASDVKITAALTIGPVTLADTARIKVTASGPSHPLGSFSFSSRFSADSTVWSMFLDDGYQFGDHFYYSTASAYGLVFGIGGWSSVPVLDPVLLSTAGDMMSPTSIVIAYKSLNPSVALAFGTLSGRRQEWQFSSQGASFRMLKPGVVRFVANMVAYGVAIVDTSVAFTVTSPLLRTIPIHPGPTGTPVFGYGSVTIPAYGLVAFSNTLDDTVDVTFDGPTPMIDPPADLCDVIALIASLGADLGPGGFTPGSGCGTGNPLLLPVPTDVWINSALSNLQIRQFTTPGVYAYRSDRLGGIGGKIIVAEPPSE